MLSYHITVSLSLTKLVIYQVNEYSSDDYRCKRGLEGMIWIDQERG